MATDLTKSVKLDVLKAYRQIVALGLHFHNYSWKNLEDIKKKINTQTIHQTGSQKKSKSSSLYKKHRAKQLQRQHEPIQEPISHRDATHFNHFNHSVYHQHNNKQYLLIQDYHPHIIFKYNIQTMKIEKEIKIPKELSETLKDSFITKFIYTINKTSTRLYVFSGNYLAAYDLINDKWHTIWTNKDNNMMTYKYAVFLTNSENKLYIFSPVEHLKYDFIQKQNEHKLEILNKCTFPGHPKLIYVELVGKLFVIPTKNDYTCKRDAYLLSCNIDCDKYEWNKHELPMIGHDTRKFSRSAVLAFGHFIVIFEWYLFGNGAVEIWFYDTITGKIYESNGKYKGKGGRQSPSCFFVVKARYNKVHIFGGYKCKNWNNNSNSSSWNSYWRKREEYIDDRFYHVVDLYYVIPDELMKVAYKPLIYGYLRETIEKKYNLFQVIPFQIKDIVLSYFSRN